MGLVSNLFASIGQFSSGFADVVVMRVCVHTSACACISFRCGDDVRLVTPVNFTTFILQSSFYNVDECKGRGLQRLCVAQGDPFRAHSRILHFFCIFE